MDPSTNTEAPKKGFKVFNIRYYVKYTAGI